MRGRNGRRRNAGGLLLWLLAGAVLLAGCGAPRQPLRAARLKSGALVVPEGSTPAERYAAEEFRRLYAEAAGPTLPIVAEAPAEGLPIRIGQAAAAAARSRRFRPGAYGPEELRIVMHADEVVITGGRPRGTLYGVYTFLEDYLGVRFLTPEHTHVPPLAAAAVLPVTDRRYAPPIVWRYAYYGQNQKHHAFAVRLRQNTLAREERLGGRTAVRLINHSVSGLLPWDRYGKEHPEYFCLRDGERPQRLERHQTYEIQPCFSHPGARRAMLANLRKRIERRYPEQTVFSVSQSDNHNFCTCPDCAARDAAAGSHAGQLLDFVNWIAAAVEKDYPDVVIGTLIYQWSRTPPTGIRPRRNVKLQLCSIECCQIHAINDPDCPRNRRFQEDLAGWAELTDNIAIWHYNVNFANYLVPCPNLFNLGPNVKYFVRNDARELFMQCAGGTTGAEFSDLRNYVICNLLWDPTRSGEALLEEFLALHYGPAAPSVRRFIDRVHAAARASGKHHHCFAMAGDYGLTAALGRRGIEDFRGALALAPDDATRARVEKASIAAWRLAVEPAALAAVQGRGLSDEEKRELLPMVKTLFRLCRRHGADKVAERLSVEKAEAVILPLLDPELAARMEEAPARRLLPTAPFIAALQHGLELYQQAPPLGFTAAVRLRRGGGQEGRAEEAGEVTFVRLSERAFGVRVRHPRVSFDLQRTPEQCFLYLPGEGVLVLAEGALAAGEAPLSLSALAAYAAEREPRVGAARQMLAGLNGPAALALLRAMGYRAEAAEAAADATEQTFSLRRGGGESRWEVVVDLETSRLRRLRRVGRRLEVSVAVSFQTEPALPPRPEEPGRVLRFERAALEGLLRRRAEGLVRAALAAERRARGKPAPGDEAVPTIAAELAALREALGLEK